MVRGRSGREAVRPPWVRSAARSRPARRPASGFIDVHPCQDADPLRGDLNSQPAEETNQRPAPATRLHSDGPFRASQRWPRIVTSHREMDGSIKIRATEARILLII